MAKDVVALLTIGHASLLASQVDWPGKKWIVFRIGDPLQLVLLVCYYVLQNYLTWNIEPKLEQP